RKRWSMLPISAEIAREYPDRENILSPRPTLAAGVGGSVHALEPAVDFALGLLLRHALALPKPGAGVPALTLHVVQIVVGQLAPLLLNLAFELFPIAFNSIPIHRVTPCVVFPVLCFVRPAGMSTRKTQRDSKSSAALAPRTVLKLAPCRSEKDAGVADPKGRPPPN